MDKKGNNLGIIITLIIQTAGIIWWASSLSAQVKDNTDQISKIQTQINTSSTITLTRDQLNDILGSRDAQITAIQENLNDFKIEVRQGLARIETKLK